MTKIHFLFIALIVLFAGCSEKIVPTSASDGTSSKSASSDASLQYQNPYKPSATIVNDITHMKLELAFSYEKKEVYGKATLTVKPYFHDVKELTLDAKGFEIKKMAIVEGEEMTEVPFKNDSVKLTITLDRTYTSEESYQVYIDYVARPYEIIKPEEYQGLFFIDVKNEGQPDSYQIWTQGETDLNSSWFPTNDKPNERFTQEIFLTVDKKFKTLSNGLLVFSADNKDGTRTDYWKQSLPHTAYLAMIAVGDFKIVKDEWKGMEVSYYVEPPYEKYARGMFGNTPKMIEFFSNKLEYPFPWEKYSQIILRDFSEMAGAMENTTAVTFDFSYQLTARELLDWQIEGTVAHELFHHWFGDLLTTESWPNLTLNEAFATYAPSLWYEFAYGLDKADYDRDGELTGYLRSARRFKHNLIWYDVPHRDDMFDGHSYSKGSRILHMLRNYLGDKLFFKSVANYLKKHEYSSVEVHDLRLSFEKTSGEDLNWFFNQWFLGKGHPELKIAYNYDEIEKKQIVTIDQEQDLEINGLYRLPIQIDIYHNGKVDSFQVVINNAHEVFSFDIPSKPNLVNVDADKMLVCTKDDPKTLNELIFQFNQAPKYLDKKEALDALHENHSENKEAQDVFRQALNHPFWDIKLRGIKYLNDSILDYSIELKNKMIKTAQTDSNSYVRGNALKHLCKYYSKDTDVVGVLESAVNDSSYFVLTTGLFNLLRMDEEIGRKCVKDLGKETNSDVLATIARFFSTYGNETDNSFFVSALERMNSDDRYMIIDYYVSYLVNQQNDSLVKISLPVLEALTREEDYWYNRYSGFTGLKKLQWYYEDQLEDWQGSIEEKEDCIYNGKKINETIEELMKQETNEKVKERLERNNN